MTEIFIQESEIILPKRFIGRADAAKEVPHPGIQPWCGGRMVVGWRQVGWGIAAE